MLRGRCLPYGDGVTFWPIAEIVRSAAGISDEDPSDVASTRSPRSPRQRLVTRKIRTAIIDRVAAAIGLTTTQFAGPELFWGIRKLLEAIANRRPLVAIVDDIHVAAPTFLELLDHLLEAVQGAPVLLLTTARHELLEARQEWAVSHAAEQVILEPLSVHDAGAIIEQLLDWPRGVGPASHRRGRRGQSALCGTDHRDARRNGGDPPGRRLLGGHRVIFRDRDPADRPGPRGRAARRTRGRGPPGHRPGLCHRARVRRRGSRQPRSDRRGGGGAGAARIPHDKTVRPSYGVRGGLLSIRSFGHQGCGLSKPPEAHSRGASRAVRRLGGTDQSRAWP